MSDGEPPRLYELPVMRRTASPPHLTARVVMLSTSGLAQTLTNGRQNCIFTLMRKKGTMCFFTTNVKWREHGVLIHPAF